MPKHASWPKAALGMAFLSLILAIIALIRTLPTSTPAPIITIANDTDEPKEQETPSQAFYYNENLGILFANPFGYKITEELLPGDTSTYPSYIGKAARITIHDPEGGLSMMITFATSDYRITEGEGCCYYFNGTLNPSIMSVGAMASTIGESLRNVILPEMVEVGGKDAIRFAYGTSYVSTQMNEGVIIPLTESDYDHIFIHAGFTKEYDVDVTDTELVADVDVWRDPATVAAFNAVLDSIVWMK